MPALFVNACVDYVGCCPNIWVKIMMIVQDIALWRVKQCSHYPGIQSFYVRFLQKYLYHAGNHGIQYIPVKTYMVSAKGALVHSTIGHQNVQYPLLEA